MIIAAPTRIDPPTIKPALHAPAPSRRASSSPGSTSENALAASMIPAPNPSSASCVCRSSPRANKAGKVPTAVAAAATEPAANAASTGGTPGMLNSIEVASLRPARALDQCRGDEGSMASSSTNCVAASWPIESS